MSTVTMGTNKVFILDKYFSELQKFWDTEKRLQDATSSGEAVNLQSKLRSLSSELTTLRTRINQDAPPNPSSVGELGGSAPSVPGVVTSGANHPPAPQYYPGTQGYDHPGMAGGSGSGMSSMASHHLSERYLNTANQLNGDRYMNGTLSSRHTSLQDNFSTLRSTKSDMTGILQHNYSNIQTGHSFHSGNLSQASGPSFPALPSSYPPPLASQPPLPPSLPPPNQQFHSPIPQASLPPVLPSSLPPTQYPFSSSLPSLNPMEIQGRPPERVRTPPEVRQKRRDRSVQDEARKNRLSEIEDLIRLEGPLTEDAVLKTLQARYYSQKYQTNIGPILVHVNPCTDLNNPITLNSTTEAARTSQLRKVAEEAIRIQGDTGYPQAIILSGSCGSGKTYASMVLLRQLFDIAGGGPETDAFKHLAAAFTVLRSLGSAQTAANRESSRIGHFIEVQVSGGALYRTKIHCYFLDQSRVIRLHPTEKNYHIFYQLMAGLSPSERRQLGLQGYTINDLRYLNSGDTRTDEDQDRERFKVWKNTLGILGIPYMDVLRVLAAILLLGNLEFIEGEGLEVEVVGKSELQAVSNLLGVSTHLLVQGLTTKTHNVRGQLVKSSSDANMSNATRDAVAKALYCRTVATIVKRANSLKKPIGSGSLSSNESVHHEVASLHASTVGTAGSKKSSKSLAILNNALRHATDGFVGVLDMFGFEDSKPSQLEQLCINLCSETMQHFFNTHTLKTSIETCREEGIHCDVIVDYNDNAHCIDLISSLRTGLLKMLDVECSVRGCPETYVQKVKVQHKENTRLFEPSHCDITRTFGIKHYAGKVVYDTTNFLDTNRDVIPDDLVSIFHKESCNFGFVTHLFGTEIKALYSQDIVPRGITFRISPTSYSDLLNGDEPVSTLTQDFHTRLDNLLRTLVHAKPHFVRCIRPNENDSSTEFNRGFVVAQVRALQILETVNLMAGGFPHRMRFKNFNSRYRMLASLRSLSRSDELSLQDCKAILKHLEDRLNTVQPGSGSVSMEWALGRKHIFLSEGIRQRLEQLRLNLRHVCCIKIQACWRGYWDRKRWPGVRAGLKGAQISTGAGTGVNGLQRSFVKSSSRPRPQPISGTPPPDSNQNGLFLSKSRPQFPDPSQNKHNSQRSSNQHNSGLQINGHPVENSLQLQHNPSINTGLQMNVKSGQYTGKSSVSGSVQGSCDLTTIQKTCSLFGLDLERPPPVPPSRSYTVRGNSKISYPQSRFMKKTFPEEIGESLLKKGENVVVVGASTKRGHLVVEKNNSAIHVPFQYLELSSQG